MSVLIMACFNEVKFSCVGIVAIKKPFEARVLFIFLKNLLETRCIMAMRCVVHMISLLDMADDRDV